MPSASNNNNTNTTKLVKQTSVNLVNSGGVSGSGNKTSAGTGIKTTENATKSSTTTNNETCSTKVVKEKSNMENSSATNLAAPIAHKDAASDALNPMKLTFTTIEHKIRNLEKRKVGFKRGGWARTHNKAHIHHIFYFKKNKKKYMGDVVFVSTNFHEPAS